MLSCFTTPLPPLWSVLTLPLMLVSATCVRWHIYNCCGSFLKGSRKFTAEGFFFFFLVRGVGGQRHLYITGCPLSQVDKQIMSFCSLAFAALCPAVTQQHLKVTSNKKWHSLSLLAQLWCIYTQMYILTSLSLVIHLCFKGWHCRKRKRPCTLWDFETRQGRICRHVRYITEEYNT